jgi:predicted acyl esterase
MERRGSCVRRSGILKWTVAAFGLAVIVPASASAALSASGSVNQVYVTGAAPGTKLKLIDSDRKTVATQAVSELGGAIFRRIPTGKYRVRAADGTTSPKVGVQKGNNTPKNTAVYNQALPKGGYGYLTTRDGTKLAIDVRLPGPVEQGPYPTLVEYSGYGYANPAGAESGISQLLNVLGYAVVDVNMRGTGCSGGGYDFFERLQGLDGYDVVETVSRQPWVMNGHVGMAGVSYGGISQLFVAATNPPHLAGITPLSVIEGVATTLYPGGILNTGFALNWAEDRADDAKPATASEGQHWAYNRIQNGDTICKDNQVLHASATHLLDKVRNNSFYRPKVANALTPAKFVNKIKMPVFMACQFNDEQTGAFCPNLVDRFTGTKRKWFTFENGLHTDSLDPETFNRWFDFMELYIAGRKPQIPPAANATAPFVYESVFGIPGITLVPDPIQSEPNFEAAKATYEKLPRVRVLFDNGAGRQPNMPYPGFEQSFKSLPIPSTKPLNLFFGGNHNLQKKPPKNPGGADSFVWDKESRPFDDFAGTNTGGGDLWTTHPSYNWLQPPPGNAVSYITPPLSTDTGIVGAGAVHLWMKASVPDVDLQVTVTEVRPDGKETYVQSGWLRTSRRKLDPDASTLLEPVPTMRKGDARKLPKGKLTKVIVPLYYQGHLYRAGSSIRVQVTAPSGDQPIWAFNETVPNGDANVTVAFSKRHPSSLILPRIPKLEAPTPLPACPALRGEPCRAYVP